MILVVFCDIRGPGLVRQTRLSGGSIEQDPPYDLVLMRLRGLIEPHTQAQTHRVQDLLDLVQ